MHSNFYNSKVTGTVRLPHGNAENSVHLFIPVHYHIVFSKSRVVRFFCCHFFWHSSLCFLCYFFFTGCVPDCNKRQGHGYKQRSFNCFHFAYNFSLWPKTII